jgi:hypothetical protein
MDLNEIPGQAIIVLVAMVIGAVKWFLEQVRGPGDADAADRASEDFEDLYEEARREIQERQARTPRESFEPPPFSGPPPIVVDTLPGSAPAPPPLPDWQKKVVKPTLSKAEQEALSRFQQQSTASRRPRRASEHAGSRIRKLLSSPGSARDAIVLSEILGPPKGSH